MSKLVICFIAFIVLLGLVVGCPHPTFITRHVCTYCPNTQGDAEAYAAVAHASRPHRTGKQSIFITNSMTYQTDFINQMCIFNQRAPKYDCYPRPSTHYAQWNCRYSGTWIAHHNRTTGHYYYKSDI